MSRLLDWMRGLFRRPALEVEAVHAVRRATAPDRRAFTRVQLDLSVRLQFASADDVVHSRTVDISRGGVFLRMSQPRPEGTKVKLDIEVAGEPVTVSGVVVRTVRPGEGSGPPGMGVLFTDNGDEQRAFIERLLISHDSQD